MLPRSPKLEEIASLHRHFIWANRMRVHFDRMLGGPRRDEDEWLVEARLYMSYWYAGLYVVIEGWRELRLSDRAVDNLLASPNVALLGRFRNGVFHFQRKYNDARFTALLTEGEEVVEWVRTLNREFGRVPP